MSAFIIISINIIYQGKEIYMKRCLQIFLVIIDMHFTFFCDISVLFEISSKIVYQFCNTKVIRKRRILL